jgi:hypothetical protein
MRLLGSLRGQLCGAFPSVVYGEGSSRSRSPKDGSGARSSWGAPSLCGPVWAGMICGAVSSAGGSILCPFPCSARNMCNTALKSINGSGRGVLPLYAEYIKRLSSRVCRRAFCPRSQGCRSDQRGSLMLRGDLRQRVSCFEVNCKAWARLSEGRQRVRKLGNGSPFL